MEPPVRASPSPRPPRRRVPVLNLLLRLSLLLGGFLLLVGGVTGSGSELAYGEFRPVSDTKTIGYWLSDEWVADYPLQVGLGGESRELTVHMEDAEGAVLVPTMGAGDPRYGLKITVIRLDPEVTPRVLFAHPEKGAATITPSADNGVRQEYDVQEFTRSGVHRILFTSSEGSGDVKVQLSIAGSAVLGVFDDGKADWFLIVPGVCLIALGVAVSAPKPRSAGGGGEDDATDGSQAHALRAHSREDVLTPDDGAYARIGFARSSVTDETEDDEGPERLARLPGKGWVIRID